MHMTERRAMPWPVLPTSRRILLLAIAVFACAASPALADWSPPHLAPAGLDDALSCSAQTFCLALTGGGLPGGPQQQSSTWNGSTWSSPVTINDPNAVGPVACPTTTLCVAVDNVGQAVYFRDGAWSTPVHVAGSASLWDVTCPSETFCAATENINPLIALGATAPDAVYFFDGTSWTPAASLPATDASLEISCTSDAFCMAVDGRGDAYTYHAGSWSSSRPGVLGATDPGGLACASPNFCALLGSSHLDNQATTWNGAGWSSPVTWASLPNNATSISCPSATFCMSINGLESGINPGEFSTNVLTFNGHRWVNRALPGGSYGPLGVSCPTSSFCLMTQFDGATGSDYYRTWTPGPGGRTRTAARVPR